MCPNAVTRVSGFGVRRHHSSHLTTKKNVSVKNQKKRTPTLLLLIDPLMRNKSKPVWRRLVCRAATWLLCAKEADRERFEESKETLTGLLDSQGIAGKPVLIFANKQDIDGCATADELSQALVPHARGPMTRWTNTPRRRMRRTRRILEGMCWCARVMASEVCSCVDVGVLVVFCLSRSRASGRELTGRPTWPIPISRSLRSRHGDPTGIRLPDCPIRPETQITPNEHRVPVFLGRLLPLRPLAVWAQLEKARFRPHPLRGTSLCLRRVAPSRGTMRNYRPSQQRLSCHQNSLARIDSPR
jgi:hypothetical protein